MEHVKKGSINSKQYWKSEGIHIDWDEGEKPPKISCEKIRKYLRHFLLGLDYCINKQLSIKYTTLLELYIEILNQIIY